MELCPICKTSALVIQNNNYYCPICKIFTGEASPQIKPISNNPPATINNSIQLPVNSSPAQEIIQDQPIKDNRRSVPRIIKRVTISLFFIFLGFTLLQNFFYIDIQNKCFIRISPSWLELSNASIKEALSILHTAAPVDYQNICKRVDKINPNLSCGGFGGGCFSQLKSRTIDVSTFHNEVIFAAVAITHETCHVQQRDENRPYDEKECYTTGYKILKDIISY